jgi:hypothetical protein
VISDTDHYAPARRCALGLEVVPARPQPILMDFGIIDVVNPLDPALGVPSYESLEPARYAMVTRSSLPSGYSSPRCNRAAT